jgi:hypothetical protein
MTVRRLTVVLWTLVVVGCAHSPGGKYNGSWVFSQEALELRADHQFIFRSWSDDGPVIYWARGTWRELPSGSVETVVREAQFERVMGEATLPTTAEWQPTRDGIQRPNRPVLRRVRKFPAHLHWPPN